MTNVKSLMRAEVAELCFRAFGLHTLSCRKRRSSGLSRSLKPLQGAVPITQAIVTAFIKDGRFARHIQRMRKLYAERREATAGLESVLLNTCELIHSHEKCT
jgi:hypothetical protein